MLGCKYLVQHGVIQTQPLVRVIQDVHGILVLDEMNLLVMVVVVGIAEQLHVVA